MAFFILTLNSGWSTKTLGELVIITGQTLFPVRYWHQTAEKRINFRPFKSLVVDEERMRPEHWLGQWFEFLLMLRNNWLGDRKSIQPQQLLRCYVPHHHHNRFTALFPGPLGWAGAWRELLDFMVQGKINRGRDTDHPYGRHSIRTNQCPPPPSPIFFTGRMPFLPCNQQRQSSEGKDVT